ncbi:MAG: glycosyltransferase family 2 protein [Caldilineales bacterium]
MPRASKTLSVLSAMLAAAVTAVLLVFNTRRLVFLAAASLDLLGWRTSYRDKSLQTDPMLPTVLALAPMRNEAGSLSGLVNGLLALAYPAQRLTIGLIDDASTDGTGAAMDALAAAYPHIHALHNRVRLGKADSLNAGLAHWPVGEIIAVYDADARPASDSLRQIAAAFADPNVAAAGGMIRPANGLASLTASYAAVERLVHQQVTMRAKERLDLAPAILGSNCAYRRADLEAAGGFPGGAFLEDSHLTVTFARQGRRTRFLPDAVAGDSVPETLRGYWRQHVRWGRGFVDVAAGGGESTGAGKRLQPASDIGKPVEAASWREADLVRRAELALFSLGYLDRLALLAGVALAAARGFAGRRGRLDTLLRGMLIANVVLPYAQIAAALTAERASPAWWVRLPILPAFFAVDAAAALWSAVLSAGQRPRTWQQTERT